jgi:hypothetical protein
MAGDEAFADGQDGVGFCGRGQIQAVLEHPDDETGNDVDHGDEHGRQRVALREPDGTVHGAVEIRFAPHLFAPLACFAVVDQSGIEVGVDRHLPARHRVQRESRGDFGNADRAVVDDEELDRDQDDEHDRAHHEVAADHELAERHDHVSGGVNAVGAVQQHETRGRDVQ